MRSSCTIFALNFKNKMSDQRYNWKKNTALFLISQTISLFGTMLVQFAIMWHIVLETQSGVMMTIYVLVGVLPTFFTSLFGGVWADKFNKKRLINLSDGAIALISLVIAISLSAGMDSILMLMIAACIRALGMGIRQPAIGAVIPVIVPKAQLLKINGINSSIQSGVFLVSPAAAAALMSFAPLQVLFLVDVITAVLAIVTLHFFVKIRHIENKTEDAEKASHFTDLVAGLKYIKSHRYILIMIVLSTLFAIFLSPLAFMTPLYVTRNFGENIWLISAGEMAFAGGMMLGGVLVGIWCFRNKLYAIGLATLTTGVISVVMGVWVSVVPYLVVVIISGISVPYFNAPTMTLMQEKVNPAFLGRVMSLFVMLDSLALPFGMLVFGPLADIININYIFIGTGIATFFVGVLYFVIKTFRKPELQNNET